MGDAMSDSCFCQNGRDPECPRHGDRQQERRAPDEDLEGYWKVVRRSNGEATSPHTMSPVEAIERIIRGLEAVAKIYGETPKRPPTAQLGPFVNKDGAIIEGHWGVVVTAVGMDIPPALARTSIEEALESTFQQVIEVIKAKRDAHRKSADDYMDRYKKEMGKIADLERVMATMGGFAPHQPNLDLPDHNVPDLPAPKDPSDAFASLLGET